MTYGQLKKNDTPLIYAPKVNNPFGRNKTNWFRLILNKLLTLPGFSNARQITRAFAFADHV